MVGGQPSKLVGVAVQAKTELIGVITSSVECIRCNFRDDVSVLIFPVNFLFVFPFCYAITFKEGDALQTGNIAKI